MDALRFLDIPEYKKEIDLISDSLDISNKIIFVTGSTGLIGSVIVDALIAGNLNRGLNNTIIATGRNINKLSCRFPYQCEGLKLRAYDVNDIIDSSLDLDYIIHTASNADPQSYATQPVETFLTNIIGTKNVLDYCRTHTRCRCLLMSTFEVYGNIIGKQDYHEEDVGILDFNKLRSCYPESKRALETMAHSYEDEYGINYVVARLCSVYGPTMSPNDSKAHAQFIKNALAQKTIVLKSKGEQIRSYCYVMDAVSAIIKILSLGKSGECYNVSSDISITSIYDLAHLVASICGLKVEQQLPTELEAKSYSRPQNIVLCNSKLRSLGWMPIYGLESGIRNTLSILSCNKKQKI